VSQFDCVIPSESHHNPSFLTDGGIDLTSTALYLPPLLSSLYVNVLGLAMPIQKFHGCYRPYSCLETHNEPSRNIPPSCMFTEARLPDIDSASLSLHKALHRFRPVTPDYATTPYVQAFNWDELHLPIDEEHEWYCVSFRSTRKLESHGEGEYLLAPNQSPIPWLQCRSLLSSRSCSDRIRWNLAPYDPSDALAKPLGSSLNHDYL